MLAFRFAKLEDVDLLYQWANEPVARANSYQQEPIPYESHVKWLTNKLNNPNAFIYIFEDENKVSVGVVRIDKMSEEVVISIVVDVGQRGKFYAAQMLRLATDNYLSKFSKDIINAYIKISNLSSYKAFIKAGFTDQKELEIHGSKSYLVIRKLTEYLMK